MFLQNVENLSPQIIRRVAKEMAELAAQPPEGIRVILNDADVTDIQAVIEGPCKSECLLRAGVLPRSPPDLHDSIGTLRMWEISAAT